MLVLWREGSKKENGGVKNGDEGGVGMISAVVWRSIFGILAGELATASALHLQLFTGHRHGICH